MSAQQDALWKRRWQLITSFGFAVLLKPASSAPQNQSRFKARWGGRTNFELLPLALKVYVASKSVLEVSGHQWCRRKVSFGHDVLRFTQIICLHRYGFLVLVILFAD